MLLARRFGIFAEIPFLLAPRGELSDGAFNLKWIRKWLYLRASRFLGLYSGLTWQVSTQHERSDVQSRLSYLNPDAIIEARNFSPLPDRSNIEIIPRSTDKSLRVCFLSRISPKKNLDFALRVLTMVRTSVVFTIYGPKECADYWAECERLIAALPTYVKVKYAGEVHPNEINGHLVQHDLFFFPTRGENYGHVIHEALEAGLPVLLSNQTPWHEVVERGVGWVLPLDAKEAFAQQIDRYAAWPSERVAEVRCLARAYALECAEDAKVLDANRKLFLSVLVGC